MDITCAKCGEPWDSYGVHQAKHGDGDMTAREAERFLKGEGCPSCAFGTICTACRGSGKEQSVGWGSDCEHCHGHRSIRVWDCLQTWSRWGEGFYYGYFPNVRRLTDEQVENMRVIPGSTQTFQTADGPARERRIVCPFCVETAPVCRHCGGDGKFHLPDRADVVGEEFFHSALDSTDDPDALLDLWG